MVLAQERTLREDWQTSSAVPGSASLRKLLGFSSIRYLLAGIVPLSVDFSICTVLHDLAGAHALIANIASRPLGGVTCFLVNRYWTFRAAGRGGAGFQFTKFWV